MELKSVGKPCAHKKWLSFPLRFPQEGQRTDGHREMIDSQAQIETGSRSGWPELRQHAGTVYMY
jgi:hypothetical protein